MDAKICDRCRSIYPVKSDMIYDYTVTKNQPFDGRRPRYLDLCGKCSEELTAFMNKDQKATNPQEFYDPVTGQIVVRVGK